MTRSSRHSACEKPRAASSGAVDEAPRTFIPANDPVADERLRRRQRAQCLDGLRHGAPWRRFRPGPAAGASAPGAAAGAGCRRARRAPMRHQPGPKAGTARLLRALTALRARHAAPPARRRRPAHGLRPRSHVFCRVRVCSSQHAMAIRKVIEIAPLVWQVSAPVAVQRCAGLAVRRVQQLHRREPAPTPLSKPRQGQCSANFSARVALPHAAARAATGGC